MELSKIYVVLPDYADRWFNAGDKPTFVTGDEINRLSREWTRPVSELMDQVTDCARIVRIDSNGVRDLTLATDYNTGNYSIPELFEIARTWEDEDGDGTQYVVEGY